MASFYRRLWNNTMGIADAVEFLHPSKKIWVIETLLENLNWELIPRAVLQPLS